MHKPNRIWVFLSLLVMLAVVFSSFPYVSLAAPETAPIRLKAATFNPAKGERPAIPPGLAISEAEFASAGHGYYIVQFVGPVEESWKNELIQRGAQALAYIPENAFVARMSPGLARQVARQPNVAYVGVFEPAFKLSPDLLRRGPSLYSVQIQPGADLAAAAAQVEAAGAQVLRAEGRNLHIAVDSSRLESLAKILDVAWIENFRMYEKHNEIGAGSIMGANSAYANGYDGSTQVIGVADTGLGGGTASTAHVDIPASRIAAIYNWPGVSDSCWTITDDGAVDVDSGHGTHVAVSAVGDGSPTGVARGTAPAARLVFQATENWATMKGLCAIYYPNGYYLTGIPTDLRTLFQQAYDAGARIHSNSWGSAAAGDYTSDSAYADEFIWFHKDMLITFSAGNEGIDANGDGVIDNDSIGSPATAKNVLTVGATENQRSDGYPCDTSLSYTSCAAQGGVNNIFTWGAAWPSDYPANPIKDDPSAGNSQQMAAFSSRGPTDDGRIKPDVVAPGSWILSGYSDLYQQGYDASPNPRNNAYQYDGYGFPYSQAYKYLSGTSMSNPLTAGGAAVVRDFYNKAYGIQASAALVKATLINSATDMLDENNDGANDNDFPIPNNHEGWGLVNLANATDNTAQFVDNASGVSTGGSLSYTYSVSAAGSPLKVTLAWSDYPSTASAAANLVNNLDLTVTSPSGTLYRGNVFSGGWSVAGGTADSKNNVENVYIQSAEAGVWTVQVSGANVPQGPQPFALVVDGNLGSPAPTPTPGPTSTPTATPTPAPTATSSPTPTATAAPTSTGFQSPSANAPVTSSSGDNNGFEVNPANAYLSDNLYAVDNNSGTGTQTSCTSNRKDRHIYYNFNLNIPTSATISGLEVRLEAKADSTSGSPRFCVQVSWDGGVSWTAAKTSANLTTSDALYTLGGPTDTWGRSWTAGQFANTSFRVRLVSVASSTARDFSLDWVAVNVYYQP
jgi:subtilisin family serine protease